MTFFFFFSFLGNLGFFFQNVLLVYVSKQGGDGLFYMYIYVLYRRVYDFFFSYFLSHTGALKVL